MIDIMYIGILFYFAYLVSKISINFNHNILLYNDSYYVKKYLKCQIVSDLGKAMTLFIVLFLGIIL